MINASGLSKAFGEKFLIDNLSFRLPRAELLALLVLMVLEKPLFRMIVGEEKPDFGDFQIGDTVKLGYVDQSRDILDEKKTVWEVISGGNADIELGNRSIASRAYVGQFNFKAEISRNLLASYPVASATEFTWPEY